MAIEYLPCVEIETSGHIDASVIWLHGLGANGHDFEPLVPELQLPAELGVRFVFPHAPSIPVTINGGLSMPAWYDILSMNEIQAGADQQQNDQRQIDQAQILGSVAAVRALIEREVDRGVRSERIILAGFSQGGAVAYHAALSHPAPLAGLLALSTYLATWKTLQIHPQNRNIPILICHGQHDPIVPEPMGRQALAQLQAMGCQPDFNSYPMDHAVCADEVRDISVWLQARLASC